MFVDKSVTWNNVSAHLVNSTSDELWRRGWL